MKKGFTLIELMAVIILLGIIITITSISMIAIKRNSEKKLCQEKEKYILTAAVKYGQEHLNDLNNTSDTHYKKCPADNKNGYNIYVNELIQLGYIVADNSETASRLLIPGQPDTYNTSFNSKTVCIRYEDIYKNKNLDNYASSYNYHGNANYQVTAKMNFSQCNNY